MSMSTGPGSEPAARETTSTPTDGLSLREIVYHRLRDEILNGRISPRERLTEPRLAGRI